MPPTKADLYDSGAHVHDDAVSKKKFRNKKRIFPLAILKQMVYNTAVLQCTCRCDGERPDRRQWQSQGRGASGSGQQMPRSAVDAGRCWAPQQESEISLSKISMPYFSIIWHTPVVLQDVINMHTCRCDGIGRRSGLKIHRWRQRAGSSPATGTK